MPGLSDLPRSYGYGDTYGARVLPGGYLQASPDRFGNARKIYGVDFPVVGYSDTGWDPADPLSAQYANTLGLQPRGGIETGGAGGPVTGYVPSPTMLSLLQNIPPNEDVMPNPTTDWLLNATETDNVGNPIRRGYPDLSGLPPVSVASPFASGTIPRGVGVGPGAYPLPGGGLPQNAAGNWQANAARGFGGFAGRGGSLISGPGTFVSSYGGTAIGPTGSIFGLASGGNPSRGTTQFF